jgi:hypothetical protein
MRDDRHIAAASSKTMRKHPDSGKSSCVEQTGEVRSRDGAVIGYGTVGEGQGSFSCTELARRRPTCVRRRAAWLKGSLSMCLTGAVEG